MTMSKMIERTSLPHPEVMPKWLEGVTTKLVYEDGDTESSSWPEAYIWVSGSENLWSVSEFSFNIEQAYEKHPEYKDEIDAVLGKTVNTTQSLKLEDLQVGMKVKYFNAEQTVENIREDGSVKLRGIRGTTHPQNLYPTSQATGLYELVESDVVVKEKFEQKQTAETLAPLLWNAYKDVLNEEALSALRDVIENQDWEYVCFSDSEEICSSFVWTSTTQGKHFWQEATDGKYNKDIIDEAVVALKYDPENVVLENTVESVLDNNSPEAIIGKIDTHYNYSYQLTQKDIEAGEIRVDAYFVSNVWKLGSKDESGVLFHCLKTMTRFGEKNPIEREIVALHKQIKRLAELHDVDLGETK